MWILSAVLIGLFLAYANGANDNFKGVATLFGSGTVNYKNALSLATITTMAGSLTALFIAQKLMVTFSGKGIVPEEIVAIKAFALSVGLAAGLTVMLATWLGFPISTTHALTGALAGIGMVASFSDVNFSALMTKIMLPLLISPFLAVILTMLIYPAFKFFRNLLGVERAFCFCVGKKVSSVAPVGIDRNQALAIFADQGFSLEARVGKESKCIERYRGNFLGISAGNILDALHYLSAGAVSFARGLNDTPKIAAILLVGQAISMRVAIVVVGVSMAIGGLINARKVAETMSKKVTTMNTGQGFTANLVTSTLVIFASNLGLPVSTTHVSCSSLFGIGAITKQAQWKTINNILLSWVITLPVAAFFGSVIFLILQKFL